MTNTTEPVTLTQECADYATSLRSTALVVKLEHGTAPQSFLRAAGLCERASARIAELEKQLAAKHYEAVAMEAQAAAKCRHQDAEPEFFTVFASHNGGKIALPGYSNETEKGVKDLVLQAARQEDYKGTVSGRLLELGWWIGPVFANSADAAALQAAPPAPVGVALPGALAADARRLAYVADQVRALEAAGSDSDVFLTEASDVLRDCADRIAALAAAPAQEHAADMQAVGEALMATIEGNHAALQAVGWTNPMDCPSEIVVDLLNLIDEAKASAPAQEQEPVAWANLKVETDSYVPFRTKEQAQASVDQSRIAATQEGPYELVALFAAPAQAQDVQQDAGDVKLAKLTTAYTELSSMFHDQIVAQQAAWIEWQHGQGAEEAMSWIENGLCGPGHIPDEDAPYGKEAQAWFDANKSDPSPVCHCGRPSNQLWMGQGFCSNTHYDAARAAQGGA